MASSVPPSTSRSTGSLGGAVAMKYPLIIVLFYPGILQEARSRANTRAGVFNLVRPLMVWGPRSIQARACDLKMGYHDLGPLNSQPKPRHSLLWRLAAESRL